MTRCLFVLAILVVNVGQAFSHHCAGTAREIKPDLSASARQVYVKKLSEARTAYAANPSDAEAIIYSNTKPKNTYIGVSKPSGKL